MNLMEQQVDFFGMSVRLAKRLNVALQARDGYSQAGGLGELNVRAVEDFEQIIMRGYV
jgi:hypothetical protein